MTTEEAERVARVALSSFIRDDMTDERKAEIEAEVAKTVALMRKQGLL